MRRRRGYPGRRSNRSYSRGRRRGGRSFSRRRGRSRRPLSGAAPAIGFRL